MISVAGILAIELQLRRGNVTAAAMRLIEVVDGVPLADDARAEARWILALLEEEFGVGIMVTLSLIHI